MYPDDYEPDTKPETSGNPGQEIPCLTDPPEAKVSVSMAQSPKPTICPVPGCGYHLNRDGSCTGCIMDTT